LRQLKKTNNYLQIVTHKNNLGYGADLRSGVKKAGADWIFFTDADMQFDVTEIEKFFPYLRSYDFIVGYRKNRADSLKRKLVSSIYNRVIRIIFGLKLKDVDCAFKLMRRSAVIDVHTHSTSFFISVELMVKAYRKNYRITEIGVKHFPRRLGKSTVTIRQIANSIKDLVKLYRSLI
jgi:glycosyltransferase involved in cell wall biosynthesis